MKTDITDLPLILCFETATPVSSVALFSGVNLLGSLEYRGEKIHGKLITQMTQHLLKDLEMEVSDLSAVCVGKGPGSYTGLRVGTSTAKGLCMSLDIPLLAISSLEALAQQQKELANALNAYICPMIDARRMEVYCELYESDLGVLSPAEAKIIDNRSFEVELNAKKVIFCGTGAEKCASVIEHNNAIFLSNSQSTAVAIGALAYQKYMDEEHENLITFEPFYLKNYVATPAKKKIL